MTTVFRADKTCAVCGKESRHMIIGSTNTFGGSPDLDTRPPEMARSTMSHWVETCPECGYTASDIERKMSLPAEYLESTEYRTCEGKEFISGLAEKFYRQYMIQRESGNTENSFYAILHCAWACDDSDDCKNADESRETAAQLADEMIRSGHENKEALRVMRADLLRRSGHFDQVIREYEHAEYSEEILQRITAFEVQKARRQDTGCYTMHDLGRTPL